jgi:hypothetical protein
MNPAGPEDDDAIWNRIAPVFSNWAFIRADRTWLSGIASRTGASRMLKLTRSQPARRLAPLIAGIGRAQLGRLVLLGDVNHDQAMSALRLTLVANISGPIGALVLVNQFLPGSIEAFLTSLPPLAVFLPLAVMLSMLIGVIWFAYAGVAASRDLNHLLRIRYGATGGHVHSEDDDALATISELT